MKKNFLATLILVFVVALSAVCFTACEGGSVTDKVTVNFMVEDENGEWKAIDSLDTTNGQVTAPEAPAKAYYTFAGWFMDKEGKEAFSATNITKNLDVYAKYTPEEVKIVFNGKEEGVKHLIDVVNKTYNPNPSDFLEFDGWYKDATCTVRWDNKEVVETLYGKTVAVITINNGYEELYTVKVNPGEVFANPAEQKVTLEDGSETTLEAKILLPYMSDKDLVYVDAEGNAIDFTKPVEQNTNITVRWNTKMTNTFLKPIPQNKDGHYMIEIANLYDPEWGTGNFVAADAPVLSFNNKFTMVKDGVEEQVIVDYIYFYADSLPDSVKKIMFGDGIKAIQGFNGVAASAVEEIVLPDTLKIIDNSFNNMPNLKGVTLPEGLEVLIGSFALDTAASNGTHSIGGANPNFEIVVPNSVKNIAMMPTNLKFSKTEETAKNGDFYKGADGNIYLKDERGLILVSDAKAVTGKYLAGYSYIPKAGTIVVPEGVVGIQVGTYSAAFDYLILPSTFKFVNYNANLSDYAEIYDRFTGKRSAGNVLFDADGFKTTDITKPFDPATMEVESYSVTSYVGGFSYYGVINCGAGVVVTNQDATAFADNKNIQCGFVKADGTDWIAIGQADVDKSVVYKDDKNSVFVTMQFEDPMNNNYNQNVTVRLEGKSNIVIDDIKAALIAKDKEAGADRTNVESYLAGCIFSLTDANGNKIEDGAAVTTDMYLTTNLVELPKLVIKSNWKIACKGGGPMADYTDPSVANNPMTGDCSLIMFDVTGISADSIKKAVFDAAFTAAKKQLSSTPFPPPADDVLKNNLQYFFNKATVEFKVDGKVVDPSTITLDNGSVTLDVVWTFA